jgi:hypothetical protein
MAHISTDRPPAVLVREGEYWTVVFAGTQLRIRDTKGMRYLAELLAYPDREIQALTLVAGVATRTLPTGEALDAGLSLRSESDLGPVLDASAKRVFRQRLVDLRAELDEAEAFNDPERAERARAELEAIVDELRAASGLGARDRRAGSPAERARLNVTRAIRGAIARIAAHDSALGEHLSACVRTGTRCVYRPDHSARVAWEVRARPRRRSDHEAAPAFGHRAHTYVHLPSRRQGRWTMTAGTSTSVGSASPSAFLPRELPATAAAAQS